MYDRSIEAFLAVASCHSISGAADLLHVTQPAISHRIRELETHLKMILIDRMRGSRRCDLTLAGESFLPIAELWGQAWRETEKLRSGVAVLSLTIGCVDSVNTYLLPQFYRELITSNPPIYLQIFTMRSAELYDKIERRELDVAFVLYELHRQNVKAAPFYREPMKIVRPSRRKSQSHKIRIKDLDPTYELYINWSPSYQMWHDRLWDPSSKAQIEFDTINLIQALMQDPRNWALVPFSTLNFLQKNQAVIVQDLIPSPPDRITYMITHRFPRIAARQGIDILESLAHKHGFLKSDSRKF
jgi:DNA-binding transcriptional LysR family regulator